MLGGGEGASGRTSTSKRRYTPFFARERFAPQACRVAAVTGLLSSAGICRAKAVNHLSLCPKHTRAAQYNGLVT